MTMAPPTDACRPGRVVLLGRRGFVASHLSRHLQSIGIAVTAVGKDEVDLTRPASVEELGARLEDTDTVVITSTLTPDKGRDVRTLMTNLVMAQHLCEVFDKRRCAHVIHLSSDAVYAGHTIPLDEDSSREPVDLYAVMHTAREMMLGSVLTARHVPFCVLRPVNIYGFGDSHNSYGPNRFIRQAFEDGRITVFGKGEERRCHLYIEDAVRLIAACIARRIAGRFNLAPPEAVTFRWIAETIRAACPFPVELEFKPRSAPTSHRPSTLTRVLRQLSHLGRPLDPTVHRTYAVAKLRRTFPDFHFTPMPEALHRYVALVQETRRSHAAAGQARV